MSTNFQSPTTCKLRRLLYSEDPVAQQLAEAEVHHQQQLCNHKFVPASLATALSCKEIKKVAQQRAESHHCEILEQQVIQGVVLRSGAEDYDHIWTSTLLHLPQSIFKWTLNAVVDMLPHKSNLKRWCRAIDDSCPLCSHKQTLFHALNGCPVSLEQHRYTWQHDKVLEVILEFLSSHLLNEYNFEIDLPENQYNFVRNTLLCTETRCLHI